MKANPFGMVLGGVGAGGVLLGVLLVALGSGLGESGENLVSYGLIICVIGLVTFVGWLVLSGVEWALKARAPDVSEDDPAASG